MELIVGYASALEYWRTVGPAFLGDAHRRRAAASRARRILSSPEKPHLSGGSRRPAGCRLPLHVLIGPDTPRTRTSSIVTHPWTRDIPAAAFASAGPDFVVASPELCFLQLATTLSLEQLIHLGYELCGTYAPLPGGSLIHRDKPLTSVKKLTAFVESASEIPGRKKTLRALRYILEGTASPRETALAMMLSLPHTLGGYGLPVPVLNLRLETTQSVKSRTDRSHYRADLCWPDFRLCLEYDSASYHLSPEQQESDARRRNSLIVLGYIVMTVSPHQLTDSASFNRLAQQVAAFIGKRLRYIDPKFTRAHLALRAELFDDPPPPGLS